MKISAKWKKRIWDLLDQHEVIQRRRSLANRKRRERWMRREQQERKLVSRQFAPSRCSW